MTAARTEQAPEKKTYIGVIRTDSDTPSLDFENLGTIIRRRQAPNVTLLENFNLHLKPGDHFVLTGPSGTGKSTVIRAARNLWHAGTGIVSYPEKASVLCLSQKVHLPRTQVSEILTVPKLLTQSSYTNEEMDQVLADVGLDKLRIQLPFNQASGAFLSNLMKPYAAMAVREWSIPLRKMSEGHRENLLGEVRDFIEQYAENFFPETLGALMSAELKKDMATGIVDALRHSIREDLPNMPTRRGFFGLQKGPRGVPAIDVAQYALQASAMELRYAIKDGQVLARELSGGEQQKLAIARLLLQKPDIAFLDEITASLDDNSAHHLYEMITERLKDSIIFAIAHDKSLIRYFTHHGTFEDKKIAVRPVSETEYAPEA